MDQLKQEFLSNMQHELRTPLAIILSGLEMINSQIPNDAPTQEILASVLAQAEKLRRLLENLLAMNDIQNENLSIEASQQDIPALLRMFFTDHRPSVMKDLRELILDIQPDVGAAFCDPDRLLQILDELLQNAVKFTPQGTIISINATLQKRANANWVRIEVSDDGPGIPPERLSKVFELFQQLDGSLTRAAGGVGLGLPLVRDLTQRMGIEMSIESEEGRGTTCILLLPTR
jgi:signal transduction histidine kinase